MTSTNDEKEVKSIPGSGQKGKSYYIELYKSLDAELGENLRLPERTLVLCNAWKSVHGLCSHSAPSTLPHMLTWLQKHTATTVLQSEWRLPTSTTHHSNLTEAISDFIQQCNTAAAERDSALTSWETQLVERAQWFKTVLSCAWEHPVLRKLVDAKGEQPSNEAVLEWLQGERGVMFVARLRQLATSKCEDFALLLTTAVMDRARATSQHADEDEMAKESGLSVPNSPFKLTLDTTAGFTTDVWEFITDVEFVLLHKLETAKCIQLAKQIPLRIGYQLVERLRTRLETSPGDKKLWKAGKDVATLIAEVVIARCMVTPLCVGVARAALYCCVRSLVRLLPRPRLPAHMAALAAPATTARHLHVLALATEAQCSQEMKPFVCELYVRAITAGMNELERLKIKTEKEAEARSMEQVLSKWFVDLGALLGHSIRVKCECLLTAFSVHPSEMMYNRLRDSPVMPTIKLDKQEQENETVSEFGSWANDSRGQTNFVKTSETLNIKKTQPQSNVMSTALLTEGEAIGLSPELCQDLTVLLSGPRLKTLTWDMDREELLENCRSYMERTGHGTKSLTTELKYLNLDPSEYEHLPEEDDGENDAFYGIEKGYEHLVEVEDDDEDDWEDSLPIRSLSNESKEIYPELEEEAIPVKKKHRNAAVPEEDPLSLSTDTPKETKKERPHSKERSKKHKHRSKDNSDHSQDRATSHEKKHKDKKARKKKDKTHDAPNTSLSDLVGVRVGSLDDTIILERPEKVKKKRKPKTKPDTQNLQGIVSSPESNVQFDGLFQMDDYKTVSPDKCGLFNCPQMEQIFSPTSTSTQKISPNATQLSRGNTPLSSPGQSNSNEIYGRPVNDDVRERMAKLLQFRMQKPNDSLRNNQSQQAENLSPQSSNSTQNTYTQQTYENKSKSTYPVLKVPPIPKVQVSVNDPTPLLTKNVYSGVAFEEIISSGVQRSQIDNVQNLVKKVETNPPKVIVPAYRETKFYPNLSSQSAKQIQKPETPNTFSRLNHLHKNKTDFKLIQGTEKSKQMSEKEAISNELERYIAQQQQVKIQNTMTGVQKKVNATSTSESNQVILSLLAAPPVRTDTSVASSSRTQTNHLTKIIQSKPTINTVKTSNVNVPKPEIRPVISQVIKPTSFYEEFVQSQINNIKNEKVKQALNKVKKVKTVTHSDSFICKDKLKPTTKANAKTQDWRSVTNAIIANKTPYRGPKALDIALDKVQIEPQKSVLNMSISQPKITQTTVIKHANSTVIKPRNVGQTVIQSTSQAENTKSSNKIQILKIQNIPVDYMKVQKNVVKKPKKETVKNLKSVPLNQPLQLPPEPSTKASDYDLLDKLLDKELLEEIDELTSDEDAPSTSKVVQITPKTQTVQTAKRNKTSKANILRDTTLTSKIIKHAPVKSEVDKPQIVIPQVPVTPEITNQLYGNTSNVVLTTVPIANTQKALFVNQGIIYEQIPIQVQQPIPTVYTVNKPNIAVFQSTVYATPVVDQVILGSAITDVRPNITAPIVANIPSTTAQSDVGLNHLPKQPVLKLPLEMVGSKVQNKLPASTNVDDKQLKDMNYLNRDNEKLLRRDSTERKVLSQVQENNLTASIPDKVESVKKIQSDAVTTVKGISERVERKRLDILNRDLSQGRSSLPPIPLKYESLIAKTIDNKEITSTEKNSTTMHSNNSKSTLTANQDNQQCQETPNLVEKHQNHCKENKNSTIGINALTSKLVTKQKRSPKKPVDDKFDTPRRISKRLKAAIKDNEAEILAMDFETAISSQIITKKTEELPISEPTSLETTECEDLSTSIVSNPKELEIKNIEPTKQKELSNEEGTIALSAENNAGIVSNDKSIEVPEYAGNTTQPQNDVDKTVPKNHSNAIVKPEVTLRSKSAPVHNLSETKETEEDFFSKITIEKITVIQAKNGLCARKIVRIRLMNGKAFKVTVFGTSDVNVHSLVANPAIKKIICGEWDQTKKFKVNIKHDANDKMHLIRTEEVKTPAQETINLISDDEDDENTKTHIAEHTTSKKPDLHKCKLNRKAIVKLIRHPEEFFLKTLKSEDESDSITNNNIKQETFEQKHPEVSDNIVLTMPDKVSDQKETPNQNQDMLIDMVDETNKSKDMPFNDNTTEVELNETKETVPNENICMEVEQPENLNSLVEETNCGMEQTENQSSLTEDTITESKKNTESVEVIDSTSNENKNDEPDELIDSWSIENVNTEHIVDYKTKEDSPIAETTIQNCSEENTLVSEKLEELIVPDTNTDESELTTENIVEEAMQSEPEKHQLDEQTNMPNCEKDINETYLEETVERLAHQINEPEVLQKIGDIQKQNDVLHEKSPVESPEIVCLDDSSNDSLKIPTSPENTIKSAKPEKSIFEFRSMLLMDLGLSEGDKPEIVDCLDLTSDNEDDKETKDPKLVNKAVVSITKCDELVRKYNAVKRKCFVKLVRCDETSIIVNEKTVCLEDVIQLTDNDDINITQNSDELIDFTEPEIPWRSESPSILQDLPWTNDDEIIALENLSDAFHTDRMTSPVMEVYEEIANIMNRLNQKQESGFPTCPFSCNSTWFYTKEELHRLSKANMKQVSLDVPSLTNIVLQQIEALNLSGLRPVRTINCDLNMSKGRTRTFRNLKRKRDTSAAGGIHNKYKTVKNDTLPKNNTVNEVDQIPKSFMLNVFDLPSPVVHVPEVKTNTGNVSQKFDFVCQRNDVPSKKEDVTTMTEESKDIVTIDTMTNETDSIVACDNPEVELLAAVSEILMKVLDHVSDDLNEVIPETNETIDMECDDVPEEIQTKIETKQDLISNLAADNLNVNNDLSPTDPEVCETSMAADSEQLIDHELKIGSDKFITSDNTVNQNANNVSDDFNDTVDQVPETIIESTNSEPSIKPAMEQVSDEFTTPSADITEIGNKQNCDLNDDVPEAAEIIIKNTTAVHLVTPEIEQVSDEHVKPDNNMTETCNETNDFNDKTSPEVSETIIEHVESVQLVATELEQVNTELDTADNDVTENDNIDIKDLSSVETPVADEAIEEPCDTTQSGELDHELASCDNIVTENNNNVNNHFNVSEEPVESIDTTQVTEIEEQHVNNEHVTLDNYEAEECDHVNSELVPDVDETINEGCKNVPQDVESVIETEYANHECNVTDDTETENINSDCPVKPSPEMDESKVVSNVIDEAPVHCLSTNDQDDASSQNDDDTYISESITTTSQNDDLEDENQPGILLNGIEYHDPVIGTCYIFGPIDDSASETSSMHTNISSPFVEAEALNDEECQIKEHPDDHVDSMYDDSFAMNLPNKTYASNTLKRKSVSSIVKVPNKKYRNGKNIDFPKLTAHTISESSFMKEHKQLMDYVSSVEFSLNVPFVKEHVDVENELQNWPIDSKNKIESQKCETDVNKHLFIDEDDPKETMRVDPLKLSFVEEIAADCDDSSIPTSSKDLETNFKVGFGEGSDRVKLNLKKGGNISALSAATLSDVKQSQPSSVSMSEPGQSDTSSSNDEKVKHWLKFFHLKQKVRSFFKKNTAELLMGADSVLKKNDNSVFEDVPGLYCTEFIIPPFSNRTVQVVQVGQLPVSAAAQNPVTCDPRVTQVSDASPSQCSEENSPRSEGAQSNSKAEYTELTNAEISTLPMMENIVKQNQLNVSEEETFKPEHQKSAEETDRSNMSNEVNVSQNNGNGNTEYPQQMECSNSEYNKYSTNNEHNQNNFSIEQNEQTEPVNFHVDSNNQNANYSAQNENKQDTTNYSMENYMSPKQENGNHDKTDQIAHAMNAAGITASPENASNNTNSIVNLIAQKFVRTDSVNTVQNQGSTFQKTSINAMSLQQALAQILPPALNQTGSSDTQNSSNNVGPQVLHIVQGKNAAGNPITLVDNSAASSGTQVLHIVQNKAGASTPTPNGVPNAQPNAFSGLSLVDAGLQQGGNQLLHIINTGNQKNANAGQLIKRVNLLTNVTNAQGGSEQKMVQFVCKTAAPHQRSMVLRLQPIDTSNVQAAVPKPVDPHELSPTQNSPNVISTDCNQEIKSRSVYEENYAKFIQNSKPGTPEKATSLPKFNQAFGKPVFQEETQKEEEINDASLLNNPPDAPECPPENEMNMDPHQIGSPPLVLRKTTIQTSQAQANLVQQIKQSIGPMNIQTMHGGVIYTRQIPVNIGGGQTINLITVPSTELNEENKQMPEVEAPIIKIVPQTQVSNPETSTEENPNSNENSQTHNPQPVLTHMRIKLPMLSKTPQVVPGARVIRPSFFQIQRNIIGGPNQPVYQQYVLTAAPPLGPQTIRLPQAQTIRQVKQETQSSPESQLSSSTLEQLREFDMVLEQVKERSTVQPNMPPFTNIPSGSDVTDGNTTPNSSVPEPSQHQQVLYSIGGNQAVNVAYVRKPLVTTPTTSTFVRSPDSTGLADSPSSNSVSQMSESSECTQPKQPKIATKTMKSRPPKPIINTHSALKVNHIPPKTSTQKPQEDEQTTQRILYILAEYKEQVENSPDKDKPAPRRRSNPPTNPSGSSKRKKGSGSRRPGCTRDHSPILGEDSCRTMGSEDSSCGTSQGDCTENCNMEVQSPQDSPRKVIKKLTFEPDTPVITQPRPQAPRNVIVADGQTIALARATTPAKPTTAVLMPANYILPVSIMKGGQQIAIVTNRGPKLLTVGGTGETGSANALLLQRLINPGLKPVLTRPGVRHVRLPAAALHNLQAFNLAASASQQEASPSPAPEPTPPDLVETRANSSPWTERESTSEVKPDCGSSPEANEPWNIQAASDFSYEETVTTRNDDVDRTVLVVQKKDGTTHSLQRVAHITAATLRQKYALLDQDFSLQKSLSEECEDLGVDSPSASDLFPEADLLFASSPAANETAQEHPHHQHGQNIQTQIVTSRIPQPDIDDQIATDHLLPVPQETITDQQSLNDVNLGLGDVGIVTVSEDGLQTTITLDQEEFARSHPNTTFHSEPTEEGEVQQYSLTSNIKTGHITSAIYHANTVPGTVLMTPQTVISQNAETVKYDPMIDLPTHSMIKDDVTRYDIMTDRELHLSNTASAIVHSNTTQVIRRVCYEDDKRFLIDEPEGVIAGDDAKMTAADDNSRDALESIVDDRSSPERHAELFWESNSASERSEGRRLRFSSDSDKGSKSPSLDETNSTDSSGVGTHMRMDSVIKETRGRDRSGSADGSSADDTIHPPIRTYPAKRTFHTDEERSLSGKTRAGEREESSEDNRRRASNRGVVKRGCHCCNGSPLPPRQKKPRQRKPTLDFNTN